MDPANPHPNYIVELLSKTTFEQPTVEYDSSGNVWTPLGKTIYEIMEHDWEMNAEETNSPDG